LTNKLSHIAITTGEPAGIGPDICIQLAQQYFDARITLIGDKNMLMQRAKCLGMHFNVADYQAVNSDDAINILHIPAATQVQAGKLDNRNSPYVLQLLTRATEGCLSGEFDAMVTAPIHKGIINDAGIPFTGHTEFLADLCKASQVVMMLTGGGMRIALVTTHLPLTQVPTAITAPLLEKTLCILHQDLVDKFGIRDPHIMVAGLNPHAGENGYLGHEEIEIINPVLARLRQKGFRLTGALPADTMFSEKNLKIADAFLTMYHDQGLPVLKHASFGQGVNITLGLPIIRTSVDHGTALDITSSGKADAGSLFSAVALATDLARRKQT
jgi:4-hydroxythreonine-4-phosphate dehydrogenase